MEENQLYLVIFLAIVLFSFIIISSRKKEEDITINQNLEEDKLIEPISIVDDNEENINIVKENINDDLFNSLRSKDSPLIKEVIDNLKLDEVKIYNNTFSIISSKTGLGKTSMLVSIAKELSNNNQILFIDLEKTKSASSLLGIDYPGDEMIHDTNTKNIKYLCTNTKDINAINRILEKNINIYQKIIIDMPIIRDEVSLSWVKFIKNFFIIIDLDFITLKSVEDNISLLEENIDLENQEIRQIIVNKFDASNEKNIEIMKILNTIYSDIPISFIGKDDNISQKILENNYWKLYESIFDKVL